MNAGMVRRAPPSRRARNATIALPAWLAGLVCIASVWSIAIAQDSTRTRVSLSGDRLSITASRIPRGRLLDRLRAQYGIEVRPYLAPEDPVDVDARDVTIDSAIGLIMPRGGRYVVRFGDREVARGPLNTGPKLGSSARRPAGLVPKRATPLVRAAGPRFKPAPERVVARTPAQGRGMKPLASASLDVPPGRGPKATATTADTTGARTLRISFLIRAPANRAGIAVARDSVVVVRAQLIDGVTPPSTIVRGPFLFAFRDANGGLVYFGSMLDPLEEHSYDTTGVHGRTEAREGTFAISVPERTLPPQRLGAVRLHLYDARAASLPATLDATAFERATARARTVATVEGRTLLAALR